MVSQTDFIRHLFLNQKALPSALLTEKAEDLMKPISGPFEQPFTELNQDFSKAPLLVYDSTPALVALRVLNLYQKSSVGIVNENGHMTANLSMADFRGFTVDCLRFLLYPVSEYIREVHKIDPMTKNICCTKDYGFVDVIEQMIQNHVHRVWIVHEGGTIPMGTITMTDLLVATYDCLL